MKCEMGWAGSTCRSEKRCLWGFGEKSWGQTDQLEDLGLDGSKILIWMFTELDEGHGLDWSGSGYGHVASCCDCGNEPSGFI